MRIQLSKAKKSQVTVTPDLLNWNDLNEDGKWKGLLLGNGGSIAVWNRFSYNSLYEVATNSEGDFSLTAEDISLFDSRETTNFEIVLGDLLNAKKIAEIFGQDEYAALLAQRYSSIRNALFHAVREVHVPWETVDDSGILDTVCNYIKGMNRVFSTNYDLLLYWAFMKEPNKFVDFFFRSGKFDISETETYLTGRTKVYYLHGAIHLMRGEYWQVSKVMSREFKNILDIVEEVNKEENIPLFVAEGTFRDKMASIRKSDYLSFCLNSFSNYTQPLVVFGNSLDDIDKHLLDAITSKNNKDQPVAISVYPHQKAQDIINFKFRLLSELKRFNSDREIHFFDSTTHPLGNEDLNVSP